MFGDQRQEATKYVIKEGYQDIYFLNKNGEWYYFEVRSAWRGKHIFHHPIFLFFRLLLVAIT